MIELAPKIVLSILIRFDMIRQYFQKVFNVFKKFMCRHAADQLSSTTKQPPLSFNVDSAVLDPVASICVCTR